MVDDIVQDLSKIRAKFLVIGARPCRLHTDRVRAFLTKSVAKWLQQREVTQSMTAGDESEANGRELNTRSSVRPKAC